MIVEAVVTILAGLFSAIGSLFGALQMPGWWADLDGMLADLAGHAAGLGHWVPFGSMINAANFVVACVGIAFVIKIVRVVVSLFTGGGGGAA